MSSSFTTSEAMSRFHGKVRKAFTGYYRIKDFIRRVRACRRAADERSLVARESAAIRTSFKEDCGAEQRYHALGKLIYIYLMGYPALFGQVECMKLAASVNSPTGAAATSPVSSSSSNSGVASNDFRLKDKLLGYLGVTLLSDDQQETLTLVTNSLKYDLTSDRDGVVALALNTLSLIASQGMARELAPEVDNLFTSKALNPNIRKKAAACAIKMVQKDPELIEIFEDRISGLLADKNHAIMALGISLLQLALIDEDFLQKYRRLLPTLIQQLKNLQNSAFNPEYDISGVPDPLIQIQLLRVLRQLWPKAHSHNHNPDSNDHDLPVDMLNDILAQLATNTDANKSVGAAVLYEVVLTIMALPVDQSLTTLAINILGRFLSGNSSGDNNLRYVALNLLHRILRHNNVLESKSGTTKCLSPISLESSPPLNSRSQPYLKLVGQIRRHQDTILACLHDPDETIRGKAAEIALLLVDSTTCTLIIPELLGSSCLSGDLKQKIAKSIALHAPSAIVYINLQIRLLQTLNESFLQADDIVDGFIEHLLKAKEEIQTLALKELFFALTVIEETGVRDEEEQDQEALDKHLEAVETPSFSTLSLSPSVSSSSSSRLSSKRWPKFPPSEALCQVSVWCFGEFGQHCPTESLCSAAQLVGLVAAFTSMATTTKSFALTALAKLTIRLPEQLPNIKEHFLRLRLESLQRRDFNTFDRTNELLQCLDNGELAKLIFAPLKLAPMELDMNIDSLSLTERVMETTLNSAPPALAPASLTSTSLEFDQITATIEQAVASSATDSLQVQMSLHSASVLTDISVALAVPRDRFDFDYLAPLSGNQLSSPHDSLTLSVLIKRLVNSPKSPSADLLAFDAEEPDEKIRDQWNQDCSLKIRIKYNHHGKELQHIGQFKQLIE